MGRQAGLLLPPPCCYSLLREAQARQSPHSGVRSCLAVATTATTASFAVMACVEKMFNVWAIMTLVTHYEEVTATLHTVIGLNTLNLTSCHCFKL